MNFIPIDQECPSKFVRSFSNYTLKQPRGVVSHIPLQLIFVADVSNHSIVIFDSNLNFVTNFTSPDMFTPWNVCFSLGSETLYVICDHGILRLNGENALFKRLGELRGCVAHGHNIVTSACFENAILEIDCFMHLHRRTELDVFKKGKHTLIIDFTICDNQYYVIFLNCDYLLQSFDETGNLLRCFNPKMETPLFITHYKGVIYINDRDSCYVICLDLTSEEFNYIQFDTSDREEYSEKDVYILRSDREFGIFYGIEFSPVKDCLIICEML